jgi:hypothetical protein
VVLAVLSYHSTLAWQSVAPQIHQRYHQRRQRQPSILQSPLRPRCVRTTTATTTIPLKDAAAHFPGNTNNSGEESLERGNPKAAADGSPYFAKNPNSSSSSSSLLRKIDDWGLGLKPKAVHANAKASLADTNKEQYWYTAKSCGLWALFILYRAYRGFFVIAPAVFRATFQKLETVIDAAPFDDQYYSTTTTMSSRDLRQNSNKQTPSWRTRFTISALAAVVTMSYLLGGALRVMRHLIQSTWNGRNVPQSLQAAATEQERNEAKLWRLATRPNNNNDTSNTNVNGQSDRLAP